MAVAGTLPAWLLQRAAERGQATVLRRKDHGIWTSVTWGELGARTRLFGMALKAVGLGPGEAVAVLSETRLEWVYADLGILGAGGVTVGLYPSDGPDAVGTMLRETGASVVFVENDEQLDKVLQIRASCPALRLVVIFEMRGLRDFADGGCESLADFLARGGEHERMHPGDWEAGIGALDPDRPATMLYTQGTTGAPKAVLLTHRNVLFQVSNAAALLGQVEGDERLAFLPMALATERIIGLYVGLWCGTIGNYVENADTVAEDLRELRPSVLAAPARLWEKYFSGVVLAADAATPLQRRLFRWAIARGEGAGDARFAGAIADFVVLRRVRRLLGLDRLRLAYITDGAVSAALLRWYRALGIRLIEIYGPTEAAGLAAVMPGDAHRVGSAGRPVPYGEVSIAPDGEILLRGPHVATAGWLHTGDIGSLADGYLCVAGRRATTIVLGDGERLGPEAIECQMRMSPYIEDVMIAGVARDGLGCLVIVDHDSVERWAQDNNVPYTGFAGLAGAPEVQALIRGEIERVNVGLPQRHAIRAFRLLEQKPEAGDPELTPMLRLRREVMHRKHAGLIDGMRREA